MVLSAQDDLDTVRQAAEQGDARAQFNLGIMYDNGEGVPQGRSRGREVVPAGRRTRLRPMRSSCSETYTAQALACRRTMSKRRAGSEWPPNRAHAEAQFFLGVRYNTGMGVLKDSVLAHMWSNIAGANGNASARELRDILERDMTRAEISRATELARACMTSDYQDCEP